MRQVSGFITEDGTFFETQEEAQLHEAESILRGELAQEFPKVDAEHFLAIMYKLWPTMGRYIDAYHAKTVAGSDHAQVQDREAVEDSGETTVSGHIGHVSSAEEDLASLLKLPPRGPSDVPHMGSGTRTAKVQDGRQEHGAGVRGVDASGVRSGKDMATEPDTEARRTRSSRGQAHLQKRKVE